MTLDLIRDEIWRHIGEPPDLDPDSDSSYNGGPLLTFVANEGQRQVASWKNPATGRIFRLRTLISEMYFQSRYISGTLTSGSTASEIILPSADVGNQDDRYNGWVVEVGNEVKIITDYTGATYTGTVHDDWESNPDSGDSYELYKRFSYLLPSTHAWSVDHISLPAETDTSRATGNLIEPLRIYDLEDERDLEKSGRTESYIGQLTSSGDPTEWQRRGNRIEFNENVPEEKWFLMEYYRNPTEMSEDTDEPELPDHLHWGIVLWGIEWGWSRHGEPASKWSAKQDFEDYMKRMVSTYEISMERSDDHGIVTVE